MLTNHYEDKQKEVSAPAAAETREPESNADTDRKGQGKHDKHLNKKKKKKKGGDRGAAKKGERGRGGKNGGGGKKNGKPRSSKHPETGEYQKPTKKPSPPKGTLAAFLDYFENKRRLLVR